VRVSLLVLCAALLPLAAVVGFTNYVARTSLIQQGQRSLATDASAKASLVDVYFQERALDGGALATLPTAQAFLACEQMPAVSQRIPPAVFPIVLAVMKCSDPVYNEASSVRALNIGMVRDSNYAVWSLFDAGMNPLLSTAQQLPPMPKEDQQGLKTGKPYISSVHFDPKVGSGYVNLYSPITLDFKTIAEEISVAAQTGQLAGTGLRSGQVQQIVQAVQQLPNQTVGFLQATLKLDYIWNIVAGDRGIKANGVGSYAFIVDQNGVRVADPNPAERFTAVVPLDPALGQLITSEQWYGTSSAVPVDDLPAVARAAKSTQGSDTFQSVAAPDTKVMYQFVGTHLSNVPWTYFVLSPLTTVTQVADDQVRTSLLAAAAVAVLAVLLGLLIGTRLATPVQRSVADLQGATEMLNTLAANQQNSAGEQLWVVDACKTGLESVRYLSDAMHQAAQRIAEASNWFSQYWDRLTEEQAHRTVRHLMELAQYIEEAARRQRVSSERLDKAITVTTQVSDQLANGATAAARSSEQLDVVVDQLLQVVGGRPRSSVSPIGEAEGMGAPEHRMPQPDSRIEGLHLQGGRPMMPEPAPQRQLPGGVPSGRRGGTVRPELLPGAWPEGPASGPGLGQQSGTDFGAGFGQRSGQSGGQGFGQGFGQGYGQGNLLGSSEGFGQGSQQGGWPDPAANGGRGVQVWEER
jgi:hypothetical protein